MSERFRTPIKKGKRPLAARNDQPVVPARYDDAPPAGGTQGSPRVKFVNTGGADVQEPAKVNPDYQPTGGVTKDTDANGRPILRGSKASEESTQAKVSQDAHGRPVLRGQHSTDETMAGPAVSEVSGESVRHAQQVKAKQQAQPKTSNDFMPKAAEAVTQQAAPTESHASALERRIRNNFWATRMDDAGRNRAMGLAPGERGIVHRGVRDAAANAQKLAKTEFEIWANTTGAKTYTTADGVMRQSVDESGRPLFTEKDMGVMRDAEGSPYLARRNQYGETEFERPKIVAADDPKDPHFYYDLPDGTREKAFHGDDALNHENPKIRVAAEKARVSREKQTEGAALETVDRQIAEVDREIGGMELETAEISQQRDRYQRSLKLFDGIQDGPAKERRLQEVQGKLDVLNARDQEISLRTSEGGDLYNRRQQLAAVRDVVKAETELAAYDEIQSRIQANANLPKAIKAEMLANIEEQREKLGIVHSESLKERERMEGLIEQGRQRSTTQLTTDSDESDFKRETDTLNSAVAIFEDESARLEGMLAEIDSGVLTPEAHHAKATEARALRDDLLRLQGYIQGSGANIQGVAEKINAAAEKQLSDMVAQMESDIAEDPGFLGSYEDGVINTANARITEGKKRVESSFKSEDSLGKFAFENLTHGAGSVASVMDMFKGYTTEDVAKRENAQRARMLIGDHRGESAKKVVRKTYEYGQALENGKNIVDPAKLDWAKPQDARELPVLQALVNQLRENPPNLGDQGNVASNEFQKTLFSTLNLVNVIPGVDYSYEQAQIDRKNPEELAKFNALQQEYARIIQEKYPNTALAGTVTGSLGQFILTRQVGAAVAGNLAKVSKIGEVLNKGQRLERTAAGLGYAQMGVAQSYSENPNQLGFIDRFADIGIKAATLATAEGLGNRFEAGVGKFVKPKATTGNLLLRQGTNTLGAFMGENISEFTEAWIHGENPMEHFEQIMKGNAGAVLGMGLLHARGAVRTQREYQNLSRQHGAATQEMANRLADVNALMDTARGNDARAIQAQRALMMIEPGEVEALNKFAATVLGGAPELTGQTLEARGVALQDRHERVLIVGQAAEALQHRMALGNSVSEEIADIESYQPMAENGTADSTNIDAYRDGARAIIRASMGVTGDQLTEGEQVGLGLVGQELGTSAIRMVGGKPVITDRARDWVLDRVPSAKAVLPRSEQAQLERIQRSEAKKEGAREGAKGRNPEATQGLTTESTEERSGQPTKVEGKKGLSVRFTGADGQADEAEIPAGATLSNGEAVTAQNAAQWLAEEGFEARDVEVSGKLADKPKAERKTAPAKVTGNRVKPGDLLRELVSNAREDGIELDGGRAVAVARDAANRINAAIDKYAPLFSGIEVKTGESGGAGVQTDMASRLQVNLGDLISPENAQSIADPERLETLVQEEAIHAVAVQIIPKLEAAKIWKELPEVTKTLVREAYETGTEAGNKDWQLGHEFLRMVVQGRINLAQGKDRLTSEERLSPTLLQRIGKALEKLRNYFRDLRGTLESDGAAPEVVDLVESTVETIEARLKDIEKIGDDSNQPRNVGDGEPDGIQRGRSTTTEPSRTATEDKAPPRSGNTAVATSGQPNPDAVRTTGSGTERAGAEPELVAPGRARMRTARRSTEPQKPTARKATAKNRKNVRPDFPFPTSSDSYDVIDLLREEGGLMGKTHAIKAQKQAGKPGKLPPEYDGYDEAFGSRRLHKDLLPLYRYDGLVTSGGLAPDQMTQLAVDRNLLGEGAGTSELFELVARTARMRANGQTGETVDRDQDFFETATEERPNSEVITPEELRVGDRFEVEGEEFEVTDIDPDTGEVEVKDGPRFGMQDLPPEMPLVIDQGTWDGEEYEEVEFLPSSDEPEKQTPYEQALEKQSAEAKASALWKGKTKAGSDIWILSQTPAGEYSVAIGNDQTIASSRDIQNWTGHKVETLLSSSQTLELAGQTPEEMASDAEREADSARKQKQRQEIKERQGRRLVAGAGEESQGSLFNEPGSGELFAPPTAESRSPKKESSTKPNILSDEASKALDDAFEGLFSRSSEETMRDFLLGKPIVTLSGKEFGREQNGSLFDRVGDFFKRVGGKATHPLLGDVLLNRRGAKDSWGHGGGRMKAAAFQATPDVITNGRILDQQKQWRGKKEERAVIAAPIKIGSEDMIMVVVVVRRRGQQFFYLHEAYTKERIRDAFKTDSSLSKDSPSGATSDSKIKLLHDLLFVNQDSDDTLSARAGNVKQEGLPPEKIGPFVTAAQALTQSGVNTPESLARVLEDKFQGKAQAYSQAMWDAIGMVNPTLRGTHDWNEIYAKIGDEAQTERNVEPEEPNVSDTAADIERSGEGARTPDAGVAAPAVAGAGRDNDVRGTGPVRRAPGQTADRAQGEDGADRGPADSAGGGSDSRMVRGERSGADVDAASDADIQQSRRNAVPDEDRASDVAQGDLSGLEANTERDSGTDAANRDDARRDREAEERALSLAAKLARQRDAESITEIEPADRDNIEATLPYLLPAQHDDVAKAETRYWQQDHRGMLFTNGTGTGKTYTGLGVIKRFHKRGKRNVLIVVPNQKKVTDWVKDARNLLIEAKRLDSIEDAGEADSTVVTTYANFRQNPALRQKDFDLVVYDESHYISQTDGDANTAAFGAHRWITNHPSNVKWKGEENIVGPRPKRVDFAKDEEEAWKTAMDLHQDRVKLRADEIEAERERLSNKDLTRVLFLSASPFAYHKSLEYADGYLFEESVPEEQLGAYNMAQDGFSQFLQNNLGYRYRTGKLTKPEADVDVGHLERELIDRLMNQGAISGRAIDVPFDYSREFVVVNSELGKLVDDGFELLSGYDSPLQKEERYKLLRESFGAYWFGKTGYIKRSQLLEALKANAAMPRIRQHIAMGRKIVLFHSYVNSQPKHPFQFGYLSPPQTRLAGAEGEADQAEISAAFYAEIEAFKAEFPKYARMNAKNLTNPLRALEREFGSEVRFFNGGVKQSDREQNVDDFNTDGSGVNLLVAQMQSAKEGISLHDTTGAHQRVVMNVALPVRPTDAIQTEGRAYRVGVQSNAIDEYVVLHTQMERYNFGSKINQRAGTAENLAMGMMARALRERFKDGYLNPVTDDPNIQQGIGGKEADRNMWSSSPFDRAKTYYYARAKKNSKTKAREGRDYFATPEPLGYKMVEWAGMRPGEAALEPSAGHGAIARFFPDYTLNKYVEPSEKLSNELRIKATGDTLAQTFEDLHSVNKFDAIVMNPPFGTAGKLAAEHLAKAANHLKDGGRIVALIPQGPSMEKRFDQFLQDSDAGKHLYLRASIGLPDVTFKRAGTSVRTRIVILDKATSEDAAAGLHHEVNRDITADSVEAFFDRIQDMGVPDRPSLATVDGETVNASPKGEISNETPMAQAIERMVEFGEWESIDTRRGEREVRRAPTTDDFWEFYKQNKEAVKEAGFSVSRYGRDWTVAQWREPETLNARADDSQIDFFTALERAPVVAPPKTESGKLNRLKLVQDNMGLATDIARRYFTQRNSAQHDDIVQEARKALMKAGQTFKEDAGTPFAGYAGRVIRNRLNDLYRQQTRRTEREGTSLDTPINEEGDTLGSLIEGSGPAPYDREVRGERKRLLADALTTLPEDERTMAFAFMGGDTLAEIGRKHQMSREGMRKRMNKIFEKLKNQMTAQGLDRNDVLSARGDLRRSLENPLLQKTPAEFTFQPSEAPNEQVQAAINTQNIRPIDSVYLRTGHLPDEGTTGATIQFYEREGSEAEEGFIVPSMPTVIFVNGKSNRAPLAWTLAHEIAHIAEKDPESGFAELEQRLLSLITSEERSIINEMFADNYGEESFEKEISPYLIGDVISGFDVMGIDSLQNASEIRNAINEFYDTAGPFNPQVLTDASDDELSRLLSRRGDKAAINDFLKALDLVIPTQSEIDEMYRQAGLEAPGAQTIGRPDLTNPAEEETGRRLVDAVDEARKMEAERQTHADWAEQARERIAKDRDGVKRNLLEMAASGQGISDPIDVKAAQILVNDLIKEATRGKNPQLMREAQQLTWAYRESGTEQARAFAARRDPFKKPADRYREFLASVIFHPNAETRKRASKALSPLEKSRLIDDLKGQIKRAKARGEDKTLKRLRTELEEVEATKDRLQLLADDNQGRLKRIEAAIAKMGVTLNDIFNGEAYLRLRGSKMIGNVAKALNYDEKKRAVVKLNQKRLRSDEIAKRLGIKVEEVKRIKEDMERAMRERLAKLGDAALDLDTFEDDALLARGDGGLTPEERAAKIDAIIAAMGLNDADADTMAQTRRKKLKRSRYRVGRGKHKRTAKSLQRSFEDYDWDIDKPKQNDRHHQRPTQRELTDPEEPPAPMFDVSDPVQVAQLARTIQSIEGNGFDMAFEFWVNSILSGPLTQGANIVGNSFNAAWDMGIKRLGEASLNAALEQIGQGSSESPQLGEFRHMARGMMPGISRGWRNALNAWAAETPMFANDILNQQLEIGLEHFDKQGGVRAAIPGKTGKAIRIPGRLLMATDEFFKGVIAQVEAGAVAYRIAKGEGLEGEALERRITGLINMPGSVAWHQAAEKATELTFQDLHEGTGTGNVLQAIRWIRQIPGARYFIPFLVTPFNIFLQGIRQSPIGTIGVMAKIGQAGLVKWQDGTPMAQSYPRPKMIRDLTEQLMAWTATAILFGAAEGDDDDEEKAFLITGGRPWESRGLNELNQRTGLTPYTIRIGDFSFNYGRIEPAATILGTTVDMLKSVKESAKTGDFKPLNAFIGSMASQASEKTFLRGIGDILDAIRDERGYEREAWATNFLASWIPNIIKQPIRELDPNYRETRGGNFGESVLLRTFPSLAPASVDVYGQEESKQGVSVIRALVPIKGGAAPKISEIDNMLLNYNQANPDAAWAPAPTQKYLTHNGERLDLKPKQLKEYRERSGELFANLLRGMSFNYANPTEQDIDKVKRALRLARETAKRQMLTSVLAEK